MEREERMDWYWKVLSEDLFDVSTVHIVPGDMKACRLRIYNGKLCWIQTFNAFSTPEFLNVSYSRFLSSPADTVWVSLCIYCLIIKQFVCCNSKQFPPCAMCKRKALFVRLFEFLIVIILELCSNVHSSVISPRQLCSDLLRNTMIKFQDIMIWFFSSINWLRKIGVALCSNHSTPSMILDDDSLNVLRKWLTKHLEPLYVPMLVVKYLGNCGGSNSCSCVLLCTCWVYLFCPCIFTD